MYITICLVDLEHIVLILILFWVTTITEDTAKSNGKYYIEHIKSAIISVVVKFQLNYLVHQKITKSFVLTSWTQL